MAKKRAKTAKRSAALPEVVAPGALVPVEHIERAILLFRGHRVMLDMHLAELYGVETRSLNQAVRRNLHRFPDDFMFRLTREEVAELNRSQSVIGSLTHRDPRYPPYVFTQEGVAMLSGVLKSARAVQVNIEIMRTFARLRRVLSENDELSRRLAELERRTDTRFAAVFKAIRLLLEKRTEPPTKKLPEQGKPGKKAKTTRPIGFRTSDD